jgi:predicted RNA methylase
MQATAQVNVLGNIIELLKTKGIITDGEIRVQIEETNSRVEETNNRAQIEESKIEENSEVQNAKQDEGTNNAEEGCDRSEKSKSNNKIHLANGDEEPALSSSQSE